MKYSHNAYQNGSLHQNLQRKKPKSGNFMKKLGLHLAQNEPLFGGWPMDEYRRPLHKRASRIRLAVSALMVRPRISKLRTVLRK